MNVDLLIQKYPRLWHMAEDGSWSSIQRHGLLSTSALLDLYQINGQRRVEIEQRHRPDSISIECSGLPQAIIRDQKPMSDGGLQRCLSDGLTAEDWYRILNAKSFFWLTEDRLLKLLNARPYRNSSHSVLVVDTASLVTAHQDRIRLSPINSGCTKPFPHPRGTNTFTSVEDYPYEARRHKGPDAVVELAVEGGVPDIAAHTLLVQQRRGNEILATLWTRN